MGDNFSLSITILLTGFVVVFAVLLILIGIIKLYGTVIFNIQNKKRVKKTSRNADLPKVEREEAPAPAAIVEAEPEVDDDALKEHIQHQHRGIEPRQDPQLPVDPAQAPALRELINAQAGEGGGEKQGQIAQLLGQAVEALLEAGEVVKGPVQMGQADGGALGPDGGHVHCGDQQQDQQKHRRAAAGDQQVLFFRVRSRKESGQGL